MASERRYIPTKFMAVATGHSRVGVRGAVILPTNDQPRGL